MKSVPIENLKVSIRPRVRRFAKKRLSKERIFDTSVSVGSYYDFIDAIIDLTEFKKSSYVCFANVHMLVEAQRNPELNEVVNGADIVTPDGRPLSLFLKYFNHLRQDRVCGMDVLPDLLRRAEQKQKSVYFYGTTEDVLKEMERKAKIDFPSLRIVGYCSPPFRELSQQEKQNIIDEINSLKPDLVLVALGCPKQELWMAEHKGKIFSCMLGLGQAFMVYTGKEKRLPKWMRDLSLEWLYRLYLEPRRLWKRYFITNSLFMFYVLRKIFTGKSEELDTGT